LNNNNNNNKTDGENDVVDHPSDITLTEEDEALIRSIQFGKKQQQQQQIMSSSKEDVTDLSSSSSSRMIRLNEKDELLEEERRRQRTEATLRSTTAQQQQQQQRNDSNKNSNNTMKRETTTTKPMISVKKRKLIVPTLGSQPPREDSILSQPSSTRMNPRVVGQSQRTEQHPNTASILSMDPNQNGKNTTTTLSGLLGDYGSSTSESDSN
jgi:hypothetical protein